MRDAALLLLADARLPAAGHAHSGGVEAAVAADRVTGLETLADFLRGRLATAGLVGAAIAAAACGCEDPSGWRELDAETDARNPSAAQRTASRAQGRALLRAGRAAWPDHGLTGLNVHPEGPHLPVALGACVRAAGGTPEGAALVAAYGSVTGPASAAVRLLGIDPIAVNALLARLAPHIDETARAAAVRSRDWAALPAESAPVLDLLAEAHHTAEVRLFES